MTRMIIFLKTRNLTKKKQVKITPNKKILLKRKIQRYLKQN